MSFQLIAAIVFTVALLVITAYFVMGSVPLLILKHDTPMDSRFVRGFLNTYYRAAMYTAGATALSYMFSGWFAIGSGAAAIALSAKVLQRSIIPKMDVLHTHIEAGEIGAIATFRRVHVVAILINLIQLVLIVWSLIALSISLR